MKKKIISILIVIIFVTTIFSCKQKEYEYYDSGKLKIEYNLEKGLRNGLAVEYYESGEIMTKAMYRNGAQNGKTYIYNPDGTLYKEIYLKDNVPQDSVLKYFPNGEIQEISIVKDDIRNGQYISYYETGVMEKQGILINDKEAGDFYNYKPDGTLSNISFFIEGRGVSSTGFNATSMTYVNYQADFSFEVSGKWNKLDEVSNAVLFSSEDSITLNIIYTPIKLSGFSSIEKIAENNLKDIKNNLPNCKIISVKKEKILDVQKITVRYNALFKGKMLPALSCYSQIGSYFILNTFVGTEKMLNSFEIPSSVINVLRAPSNATQALL